MKIRTQLITGFSALLLIMVIVQGANFYSKTLSSEAGNWIRHTHEVMADAAEIKRWMVDMETGERGFLITGEPAFLEPYTRAKQQLEDTMSDLQKLVTDNPEQVNRLKEIEALIHRWDQQVGAPLIAKRLSGAHLDHAKLDIILDEIREMVASSAGKILTDQIRVKFDRFMKVEEDLLAQRRERAATLERMTTTLFWCGTLLFVALTVMITTVITRTVYKKVGGEPEAIEAVTRRIAEGDLNIDTTPSNETGILASVMVMLESLKKNNEKITRQTWLSDSMAGLADVMRGNKAPGELCNDITGYLARQLDLQVGTLSLADADQTELTLTGRYAFKQNPDMKTTFKFGEGLTGQAARDRKPLSVNDIPEETITVTSALGEIPPAHIYCLPLLYESNVEGVIELGSLQPLTETQQAFLDNATERIAIAVHSARAREKMKDLLEESQSQAEELQAQTEELETQQEELRVTNEELEEKATALRVEGEDKSSDLES